MLTDYFHVRIPTPVILCGDFTRMEMVIFGVLWSAFLMKKRKPFKISVSEVARRSGATRTNVLACRKKMIDLRYMNFTAGLYSFIEEPAEVAGRFMNQKIKDRRDGEWDDQPVPNEDRGCPELGQVPVPNGDSKRSGRSAARRFLTAAPTAAVISDSPPPEDDDVVDYSRPPDEVRQPVVKPSSAPRVKKERRKPSGDELALTPSLRWEFMLHAEKASSTWTARDVVGYWVAEYLRRRGEEDPELHFAHLKTSEALRLLGNVKRFTEMYLDGNYSFAKKAVEDILTLAEKAGKPVVLRYFFTPRSDATLRSLTSRVRGGGGLTPRQRDDISGSDVDRWVKLAEEQQEKKRAANR